MTTSTQLYIQLADPTSLSPASTGAIVNLKLVETWYRTTSGTWTNVVVPFIADTYPSSVTITGLQPDTLYVYYTSYFYDANDYTFSTAVASATTLETVIIPDINLVPGNGQILVELTNYVLADDYDVQIQMYTDADDANTYTVTKFTTISNYTNSTAATVYYVKMTGLINSTTYYISAVYIKGTETGDASLIASATPSLQTSDPSAISAAVKDNAIAVTVEYSGLPTDLYDNQFIRYGVYRTTGTNTSEDWLVTVTFNAEGTAGTYSTLPTGVEVSFSTTPFKITLQDKQAHTIGTKYTYYSDTSSAAYNDGGTIPKVELTYVQTPTLSGATITSNSISNVASLAVVSTDYTLNGINGLETMGYVLSTDPTFPLGDPLADPPVLPVVSNPYSLTKTGTTFTATDFNTNVRAYLYAKSRPYTTPVYIQISASYIKPAAAQDLSNITPLILGSSYLPNDTINELSKVTLTSLEQSTLSAALTSWELQCQMSSYMTALGVQPQFLLKIDDSTFLNVRDNGDTADFVYNSDTYKAVRGMYSLDAATDVLTVTFDNQNYKFSGVSRTIMSLNNIPYYPDTKASTATSPATGFSALSVSEFLPTPASAVTYLGLLSAVVTDDGLSFSYANALSSPPFAFGEPTSYSLLKNDVPVTSATYDSSTRKFNLISLTLGETADYQVTASATLKTLATTQTTTTGTTTVTFKSSTIAARWYKKTEIIGTPIISSNTFTMTMKLNTALDYYGGQLFFSSYDIGTATTTMYQLALGSIYGTTKPLVYNYNTTTEATAISVNSYTVTEPTTDTKTLTIAFTTSKSGLGVFSLWVTNTPMYEVGSYPAVN